MSKTHVRFKRFSREMNNIWQEYNYLQNLVQEADLKPFIQNSLLSKDELLVSKKRMAGDKDRFLEHGNLKTHFIDAINLFEDYICDIAIINYSYRLEKMGEVPLDAKKTYKFIYKYDDVSSVLDRVIEEKVRSIFYGNPVEFFTKDKCKLECKTYFENYDNEIKNFYTQIVARRNIIIHNQSRVDSKFIKEVPTTLYKKGNKIALSENYLRGTYSIANRFRCRNSKLFY